MIEIQLGKKIVSTFINKKNPNNREFLNIMIRYEKKMKKKPKL